MPKAMLLTIPEACRELGGLSRAQLYRYIESGELDCVHLGRLIKVRADSLEAFVARQIQDERLNRRFKIRDRGGFGR